MYYGTDIWDCVPESLHLGNNLIGNSGAEKLAGAVAVRGKKKKQSPLFGSCMLLVY